MAINERLVHTASAAAAGAGNQEEGLILHLDANDVDSYDGDGDVWYDIKDHEYTPTTDVSEHFNTVTYTGDGAADRSITGVGFQPDLVWIKNRDTTDSHQLYDSLRGNYLLYSNGTDAQYGPVTDWEIEPDGFDLGIANGGRNGNGNKIVAWCFKAGGAPSGSDKVSIDGTSYADEAAAGLTAGTALVGKLSVNTKLGFSIVEVDTNISNNSQTKTIAHGLNQKAELIITKTTGHTYNWWTSISGITGNDNEYLALNANSQSTIGSSSYPFGNPNSSVFSVNGAFVSEDIIAYCFASKRGVSKVGGYTGTGAAGNKVYTGFEPAFVMVKRTNGTGNWMIHDNKRSDNDGDGQDLVLYADLSNSEDEYSTAGHGLVFNRDGFTINATGSDTNASSSSYIYYAVAKNTNETELHDTDLELHLDADSFPEKGESGYSNTPSTWTALTGSNGAISGATFDSELGNYLSFDGVNDYLSFSQFDISSNSTVTIELWVNPDSSQVQYANLFDYGHDSSSGFTIQQNSSATNSYYVYNSGVVATTSIDANKWTHLCITGNGTNFKMYVNGDFAQESTATAAASTSGKTLNIGRWQGDGGTRYWKGKIGQVRIHSAVLSETEIRQNFNFTKNSYPNGVDFTNAGGRANWLPEGSWNFDSGGNEYFTHSEGAFQSKTGNSPFAISAWVKPDEVTSSWRVIIGTRGYSDGSSNGWQLYVNQDDIKFWADGDSSPIEVVTANGALTAGTWTHVVVQRTSTEWEVYIDGDPFTNSSSSNTSYLTDDLGNSDAADSQLVIGRNWQTNQYQWDGQISDIKIFSKALTPTEVTAQHAIGYNGIG